MANTKMLAGGAVLAAMLMAPGVINAQQHQHRDSTRQGMMMHESMGNMHMGEMMNGSEMMLNMMGMSPRVMRLQPNQVLGHVDELKLTQGQKLQIEQIAAHSELMSTMVGRTNQIDQLLGDEDVSDTEIREWVEGSVEYYRDMHGRMILDALAVREILSLEQREAALGLALDPSAMMMHRADMMMPRQGRQGHKKP
jgi:hypothetical protein